MCVCGRVTGRLTTSIVVPLKLRYSAIRAARRECPVCANCSEKPVRALRRRPKQKERTKKKEYGPGHTHKRAPGDYCCACVCVLVFAEVRQKLANSRCYPRCSCKPEAEACSEKAHMAPSIARVWRCRGDDPQRAAATGAPVKQMTSGVLKARGKKRLGGRFWLKS